MTFKDGWLYFWRGGTLPLVPFLGFWSGVTVIGVLSSIIGTLLRSLQ